MTEGEQGFDLLVIKPAITDLQALGVGDLRHAGAILRAHYLRWQVCFPFRESQWQLTRRIYPAKQNVRDRVTTARPGIPSFKNRVHGTDPWHEHRRTGFKHHDRL